MLWRRIPVATAAAAVVGGGAAIASAEKPVLYTVAAPVTVQAMGVDSANPMVGDTITAGVKVVAERDRMLDYAVVAVRDGAGRNFDFPGVHSWRVGSSQKIFTARRSFAAAGTYTYWFAYQQGGQWMNLSPRMTFTVAPSGASPAPTTSPAPSPSSPAPSPSSSPSQPAPPPAGTDPKPLGVPGTWNYKFGDDFTGPVAWGTKWADSSSAEADNGHGNLGNQQLEWNHKANCSTANGILSLTAKPDNIVSPSGTRYNWSSCLLSSSPSYAFRYGYIEIRAQLPGPKGFWPAFWTWQAAGNDRWTETDVFEFYSDNHSRLYLTQHSGSGGHLTYSAPFDPTTGFHTYGADIAPDGTRFYIDGKLVYTAPGTSTGMTNIIVDNFVYSRIPPAPGTTGVMKVDYVRAWQR
jgi:beta-glucanase (GH16 family)